MPVHDQDMDKTRHPLAATAIRVPKGWVRRRPKHSEPVSPVSRQRVDEWVAWAQTHTVVEKIGSPPGFLADCDVAPGAITVGHSPQEALDEMRSALIDWANLRAARGYDLPSCKPAD